MPASRHRRTTRHLPLAFLITSVASSACMRRAVADTEKARDRILHLHEGEGPSDAGPPEAGPSGGGPSDNGPAQVEPQIESQAPKTLLPAAQTPRQPLKILDELTENTACVPALPASEASVSTTYNINYATIGGEALTLDIASPKGGGTHPLVVLVHGGGYTSGDKTGERSNLLLLAGQGYVAAAVNYRLASGKRNHFPAQIQDLRCAIRWLRSNAQSYDIDPQQIAAVGHSAGGTLVSLLATADDDAAFDHPDCPIAPAAAAANIKAAIDNCGRTDIRLDPAITPPAANQIVINWLGFDPRAEPGPLTDAIVKQASPISHVSDRSPPFLLINGGQDPLVTAMQYSAFAAALTKSHVEVHRMEDGDWGHAPPIFSAEPLYRRAHCGSLRFLSRQLHQATP